MKFWIGIAQTIIAAAIIGVYVMLMQLNARVAVLESHFARGSAPAQIAQAENNEPKDKQ